MYFESEEGGMSAFEVYGEVDLKGLYGWGREDCKDRDNRLLEWMDKADIGELYDHRLGCIVRLKDI